jgi:hypothetical protein
MEQVRAAFDMVNQSRKLPMMLDVFLGSDAGLIFSILSLPTLIVSDDMRKQFFLIQREVVAFMAQYEVGKLYLTKRWFL